jgi:hypothetical protein
VREFGLLSSLNFKHSCELTHGSIFRLRLPLKNKHEMSTNLGLESIFIQPRHQNMYWKACADKQTIPGCEIGGIPRNVTWRNIVSEETRNDKLFWCWTKIACWRWREPHHLVSVALALNSWKGGVVFSTFENVKLSSWNETTLRLAMSQFPLIALSANCKEDHAQFLGKFFHF